MRVGLRKWYLDCVSDAGDAGVIYAGRVSAGALSLPYFEVLSSPHARRGRRFRRLSRRANVQPAERGITLDATAFGVTGKWSSRASPIELRLFDGTSGRIDWRCHAPAALAEVELSDGTTLTGLGYVEELTMTVAPWALPFDDLRWGRFVSKRRHAVWIDWRGGLDRRWVFVDGVAVKATQVEREHVVWENGSIEIDTGRVLREGRLGKTIAGPGALLLPRRVGQALETKWISPASLHDDRHTAETGWVIHELVRWG